MMTDLFGTFFTVITEADRESFSAWEADAQKYFGDPRFAAWFERMTILVESAVGESFTHWLN